MSNPSRRTRRAVFFLLRSLSLVGRVAFTLSLPGAEPGPGGPELGFLRGFSRLIGIDF
jgi:hypothetical protein